jgi:hypothetical protein
MAVAPGTDIFNLMNDPFADLSDCEDNTDFGDIFDSLETDAIQSEQRAVLLELTEEMALITAELQHLKEDQSIMEFISEPAPSMKRRNRGGPVNNGGAPAHSTAIGKRRKTTGLLSSSDDSDEDIASGFVRYMSKEELLNTITQDLHPRYLEGVIRIVNPAFDPATATDEDLEFDINLLADDVLYQLMQYVQNALEATTREAAVAQAAAVVPRKTAPASTLKRTQQNDVRKKVAANRIMPAAQTTQQPRRNVAKKEGPRQRLMKRAPKKRGTPTTPHAAPSSRPVPVPAAAANKRTRSTGAQRKTKQQQQQQHLAQQLVAQQVHLLGLKKQNKDSVSGELMREIFQSEEIIRVHKCMSDEEEDEDVDILA